MQVENDMQFDYEAVCENYGEDWAIWHVIGGGGSVHRARLTIAMPGERQARELAALLNAAHFVEAADGSPV